MTLSAVPSRTKQHIPCCDIGPYYIDKVVRPEVRNQVRLAVSAYSAAEVHSEKRTEIQNKSMDALLLRFSENSLVLDELLIRNVGFSQEQHEP